MINKIFSTKQIYLIAFISSLIIILFVVSIYTVQISKLKITYNNKILTQINKNFNKQIYEIEASLNSLRSFYQASDDFSTSMFGYMCDKKSLNLMWVKYP